MGVGRVGEGKVEGASPALALALGRIAGSGVKPPAFFAGKLPPAGQQGFEVGAFRVLHERPKQHGQLAATSGLRALSPGRKKGGFGLCSSRFHAANQFLLHSGRNLLPHGPGDGAEFAARIAALGPGDEREPAMPSGGDRRK